MKIKVLPLVILFGILTCGSCNKTDEEQEINNSPTLSFYSGVGYVSSNIMVEEDFMFKIALYGNMNTNTNVELNIFKIERIAGETSEIWQMIADINEPNFTWEGYGSSKEDLGEELWVFTILDYSGESVSLSFKVTTVPKGTLSPEFYFIESPVHVSYDTVLFSNTVFLTGIVAESKPNSINTIEGFRIKTQLGDLFEDININKSYYTWEDSLTTVSYIGNTKYTFTIIDNAGMESSIDYMISTVAEPPPGPDFSISYSQISQGGVDYLDFNITCITDDWEMTEINVSYPQGLGSETYFGNGQIFEVGTPYNFPNYFPEMIGDWIFSINGIIKSGVHVNEIFEKVVVCHVTVL